MGKAWEGWGGGGAGWGWEAGLRQGSSDFHRPYMALCSRLQLTFCSLGQGWDRGALG